MGWWGKMIGGTVGFFFGGPLGALLGAAVGHGFDASSEIPMERRYTGFTENEKVQTAFFTALFSIMGHLATADGKVSEKEAEEVQRIMEQMRLVPDQQRVAVKLFNQGRRADFPLHEVLEQFRKQCNGRRDLVKIFLEILLKTAMADGEIDEPEYKILSFVSDSLHFPRTDFEHIVRIMEARHHEKGTENSAGSFAVRRQSLQKAYEILGLSKKATEEEIKKAYRNLMSQYHPDKMVSKGLPEEMIKFATEKTREIKAAYDVIKESRSNW
ncbi:MAG: co-chaperone DjlA [Syntrophales bacterium]|jgi:DnaJ like chaperone protein|nr:co-chaperone DjlA [Syntrophales bacterium]MDY0045660.1 co-chaperone DjlA [Syntrophales bacterium]